MGSTRFPGKSLAALCGMPLLAMLLHRLTRVRTPAALVVAAPEGTTDDAIAGLAHALGVACVRGTEADVLARFITALDAYPARNVVRICADNPLTDPALVDALIGYFSDGQHDYAQNLRAGSGYPDGLGAEIITADALRLAHRQTADAQDREHVTLFVARQPARFRCGILKAPAELTRPQYRLDVDYPADLAALERLCAVLPPAARPHWTASQIVQTLDAHPGLLAARSAAGG